MSDKKNKNIADDTALENEKVNEETVIGESMPDADEAEAAAVLDVEENEVEKLKAELEKEKKEYLFLMAEFDNFRKRTMKEKAEIIKNASGQAMKGLLPIVDDFERGLKSADNSFDVESVRQGMELIYNELVKFIGNNGVKPMVTDKQEFDPELHEAVAQVPAADPGLKDKIIDTIQKGYTINDKVLRHAKVVVAK